MTPDRARAARELLAFYVEAGVDAVLGEEPVNWFANAPNDAAPAPAEVAATGGAVTAQVDRPAPPTALLHQQRGSGAQAPARSTKIPGAAPLTPEVAVMAAREQAKAAASLAALREVLERFEGCALRNTATQLVFADGNPEARVMFVGEAPGRDEDLEGLPFVGRSGKLLDRMLAAIGLDRTSVYIANVVPWRPPGNRTPTPQESSICLPFTLRQIELADPDVLVCLGQPAMQALLGINEGILKTRGRWFSYHTGTREIRAMATLHPAYLLRQPLQKRLAWRDFLSLKKALESAKSD
jgi:uracil-DNA glycosylase